MTPSMTFPKDFVWGAAAASYQVEGAVYEDGRGLSVWDMMCRTPGKIGDGHTGEVGCDHYHRWQEDVEIMKAMGLQAYRLSVAWPRILPEGTGTVNLKGLANTDWISTDGQVHDPQRIDFLTRYLREFHRAIGDGVGALGYFQWSIMDNFEWAFGYKRRFGLVYVDYPSGRRLPKDSARWYQKVIATHGAAALEEGLGQTKETKTA